MQRVYVLCFLAMLLSFGPASQYSAAAPLYADLVIYNGKIITVNDPDPNSFTTAQAAAIYDEKFIAVGTNDEALQFAGPKTRKIDLSGRIVIPGLIETHNHIYDSAAHFFPPGHIQVEKQVPEIKWTNKDDFLAQLRTVALKKKPGEWIVTTPSGGQDGIVVELQRGDVTRFDLDKVTPNNPLYLHWNAMEEALVNSKALDALLSRYPNIRGVLRDAKGVATGRLKGLANNTVRYEFWPEVPPAEFGPYYKMEMEELAAQGITTNSTRLHPQHLNGYAWLNAGKDLPVRMPFSLETTNRNPNVDATASRIVGLQGGSGNRMWGLGDDKLWIIGVSLSNIDGIPATGASCVNKEYPREAINFPLWRYQFYGPYGMCGLSDPEFNDADEIRAAAKYGFRLSGMHTGGDRGVNQMLDLMEELTKEYPDLPERRWAFDHCRFLNEDEAKRAKKFNVMFSCGPKYLFAGEKGDIGAYKILYGEKVADDVVVPLRRIIDNGLRASMQLDQHGFYPFLALQVVVTRKDSKGNVWGANQRITRREALYMYTRWGAEYVLRENTLGSIEPKKYADFTVLDRDYLTIPEDEMASINSVLTVMGGKITYTEPAFAANTGLATVGFQGDRSRWQRGMQKGEPRVIPAGNKAAGTDM